MHREIAGFTDNARAKIVSYNWPGNIRQLANTIERAVILEDGKHIHAENLALPEKVVKNISSDSLVNKQENVVQPVSGEQIGSLAGQEKDLILRVLEECLWVQKNAAEKLGISPRALNYKISKLGITHPHWRRNKRS